MLNFIIAILANKGIITEDEGKKIAKSVFGRPLPSEYDSMVPFVERLFSEAKRSLERKYFDPDEFEKGEGKIDAEAKAEIEEVKTEVEKIVKKPIAKKK